MTLQRPSRKTGHPRKILAIIDETPESRQAVAYASRRAKNTKSNLVLLFIIDNSDFQHILGVNHIMRAEAEERARDVLTMIASQVQEDQDIQAEQIVREGKPIEEIARLVQEDQDISVLVLAAGSGNEGPGPLIQALAGRNAAFPIPVTVIPAGLSEADIDSLA